MGFFGPRTARSGTNRTSGRGVGRVRPRCCRGARAVATCHTAATARKVRESSIICATRRSLPRRLEEGARRTRSGQRQARAPDSGGQPRRWRSQRLHAVDGNVGPGMPQGHGLNYFRLWIQFWMGRPRREAPVRYCARPWLDWPVGLGGKASCIRRNGASPRLGEIFSSDPVAQRSRSRASPASLPPAARTTPATDNAGGGWPTGAGGIPLARPNHPVTLERWEAPIASGMQPETGGTFTIFNYPEYIDPARAQGLRQEVRGHGEGHAVRRHHHRRHEAGIGDRVAGRDRDDARPAPPRRRGQAGEAAQSRLHPEPEERLVRFQEPVLRRRVPLLRAVHGLQHRHRVPHRPRQGGHPQSEAQPLGHLLAGPGVQGQDRAALRGARDDRDGAPAQAGSRTSTPRTRSSSTRP